jgi:hypothetical protein
LLARRTRPARGERRIENTTLLVEAVEYAMDVGAFGVLFVAAAGSRNDDPTIIGEGLIEVREKSTVDVQLVLADGAELGGGTAYLVANVTNTRVAAWRF